MTRTLAAAVVAALAAGSPVPADEDAAAANPCQGVAPYTTPTLASVVVVQSAGRLNFATAPPGDTSRLFIVEQPGRIRLHKRGQAPGAHTVFLDMGSKVYDDFNEAGFLGLAFDPGYASTLHFWVNYTELVGGQIYTVVARYSASSTNPDVADPNSELRVLRFAQPQPNHNGGMLAFGKDGFLYVFTGDGGGDGDNHGTCGNGQSRSTLLGKILRLDVRGIDANATPPDCGLPGAVYGVPATNPLSDGSGGACDEIWSYGVRNPWRASFDAATGDLFIGEVGEVCWEELDWAPSTSLGGVNYGWRQMEGTHCFDPTFSQGCDPPGTICVGSPPCGDASLTRPILDVSHGTGACAIVGGYVYRGCRLPDWTGRYFYSDYCAGFVKTFRMVGGVPTDPLDVTSQVSPTGALNGVMTSFGQDGQGELYAVTIDGFVRKIVPPFANLEVAAAGTGSPFRLNKGADWTWEDLYLATEVPVSFYRVYRGAVNGAYTCVLKTTSPVWVGGDPVNPPPGGLFAYVVTAVDGTGQETKRGTTGTFNAATCP